MAGITILKEPQETLPHADTVATAADAEKDALGFLPASTYASACATGRLFVAVDSAAANAYAGHVMFGGAGSEVHIYQLLVDKRLRQRGVAHALVRAVVDWAEGRNYLGIAIRVAADLRASNDAWDRLGFRLVRKTQGGSSRGRTINLRHRELRSRSLLSFVQAVGRDNVSFSVPPNVGRGVPTYVIDLNVLFDCLRDRGRRATTQQLFGAAFSSLFRLVVTSEFTRELERHTAQHGADPLLELAKAIPQLRYERVKEDDDLYGELAQRVFPVRAGKQALTDRDRSDISHLIIAIRSRAFGFVTSEAAILNQRDWLRESHDIDVVGVEEVVEALADALIPQSASEISPRGDTFEILDGAEVDEAAIEAVCKKVRLTPTATQRIVQWLGRGAGHRVVFARASGAVVAAVGWSLVEGPPRRVESVVIADSDAEAAVSAVDFLVETMVHAASRPAPTRIDIQVSPLTEPLQQVLQEHGITRQAAGDNWTKIAAGRPIDGRRWPRLAREIRDMCGLSLPSDLMKQRFGYSRSIRCKMDDGKTWIGSLDDLEGLLSPVLLTYSERPAAIVPIRGRFAEDLFGHLQQAKLFSMPIASFRRERVYYTASQSYRLFARGSILLFYESGKGNGRQAVVSVARALGARVMLKAEIPTGTLSRGVLDKKEIANLGARPTVTAVSFDNVIMLPKPVTLEEMRANSWVPGHSFITTTEIESDIASSIIQLGYSR
jgi:GNAT superfamily N-acetyltransferase/predicted nucleic acid-binding protein